MFNNVVEAMEDGFSSRGLTTLRFNFRGVGESGGLYDEGEGETDDLIAALRFLRGALDEGAYVVLAGYSFGAWICGKAASRERGSDALFLVAYPFSSYGTDELKSFDGAIYFVGGTLDEIGPMDALLEFYGNLPLVDKYLENTTCRSLLWGKEGEIARFIKEQVRLPAGLSLQGPP